MASRQISRLELALLWLPAGLAISCKPNSSSHATGPEGAEKDASTLVAPVQTWVPYSDDPNCEHAPVVLDCSDGWCRIPAGCFVSGSPEDEAGRGANTEDLTTVHLTHDFMISQFETTRRTWSMSAGPLPDDMDPVRGVDVCNDLDCPMTRVSWFAAMAYANSLSAQATPPLKPCYLLENCSGSPEYAMTCESVSVNATSVYECEGYRLPTEVEWEYAARAGARTPFFAGPMSPAVAQAIDFCLPELSLDNWDWYCQNTPDKRAQPVGRKGANAWGLHDVLGNVSEFVSNPRYTRQGPGPVSDPWGNVDASLSTAVRGGYFSGLPDYARLACRTEWRKTGDALTGFRLVRTMSGLPRDD